MVAVRTMLAVGVIGLIPVMGGTAGGAQTPPARTTLAPLPVAPVQGRGQIQGAADMPTRRPEETQADPSRAFDIDKDGTLDLAEVKSAAAAHFDELNPDADDSLDRREAGRVLGREAFRRADTNRDGTVSKAEYLAYAELLFRRANADKDGTLDQAELRKPAGKALTRLLR